MKRMTIDVIVDDYIIHLPKKDGSYLTYINPDAMSQPTTSLFGGVRRVKFLDVNPNIRETILDSKARLVNFLRSE